MLNHEPRKPLLRMQTQRQDPGYRRAAVRVEDTRTQLRIVGKPPEPAWIAVPRKM